MKIFLIATLAFLYLGVTSTSAQCPDGWLQTIKKADRSAIRGNTTTDDSGNLYIGLSFYDTVRVGNLTLAGTGNAGQWQDIGLIKIGKDGTPKWAIQSSLQPDLFIRAVKVDKDFNVHFIVYSGATTLQFGGVQVGTDTTGGIYRILLRPDGSVSSITPLAQRGKTGGLVAIPMYDIARDGRTGLLFTAFQYEAVLGSDTLFSNRNSWFLAAFDQMGQKSWTLQGGEAETIFPGGMKVGSGGSIYLSFSFYGNLLLNQEDSIMNRSLFGGDDVGVAHCIDNGKLRWTKAFTGLVSERFNLSYVDGRGNFYGSLANESDAYWNDTVSVSDNSDIQLIRFDSTGNIAHRLRFYGKELFLGATAFKNNRLLISGSYVDTMEVDGYVLPSYPQNFTEPRKSFMVITDTALQVQNAIPLKSSKHIAVGLPEVADNDHIYISGGFYENLDLPSTQLALPGQWGNFVWKTCLQELTAIKESKVKRYQEKAKDLVCIPNPALYNTSIEVPEGQIMSVGVYDLAGRPVLHLSQPKVAAGRIEINISALPIGLYTIIISSEKGTSCGRFVKDGIH